MSWNQYQNWDEAEKAWNEAAQKASKTHPLKVLKTLPSMPGIADDTARGLKWKSLKWMIAKDHNWVVTKQILKKPLKHFGRYLRSLFKKKSYVRDGDFFLYGMKSVDHFKELLQDPNALFVVGFSYCEKPQDRKSHV